ncbi:class I SAM-dependent methyltransferase [Photobacterium salinisoli]|uniref:class I SAM-dependent methyltransferase n=1 Tax=Photobacterium salinisoli TaxID=1616783 RepID=UPI000EA1B718|nr:class I SAM-dependent methyltransferase [Photobacterium salinisoli]
MTGNTERFSDRVDDYLKYRPGYPQALIETLVSQTHLGSQSQVADIGAGTGILTKLLLEQGLQVSAIEPNDAMRQAADHQLADYSGYTSFAAPAERTGLADASVDLITAAQSFHWFCNAQTRTEFQRIAKPGAHLALIWNQRKLSTPIQQQYDELLTRYGTDYTSINHMNLTDGDLRHFFADGQMQTLTFAYRQYFDLDGFIGRVRSASYCPPQDSTAFHALTDALTALFNAHQIGGQIMFDYDTNLYLGNIHKP